MCFGLLCFVLKAVVRILVCFCLSGEVFGVWFLECWCLFGVFLFWVALFRRAVFALFLSRWVGGRVGFSHLCSCWFFSFFGFSCLVSFLHLISMLVVVSFVILCKSCIFHTN